MVFSRLFSPINLGNLSLKNRIVMPAMHLGYCPTGEVTARLIEFYRLRARGGAGLIIVGGCGIDRLGNAPGMIQVDDDRYLPGLVALAQAIHTEGGKVVAQLYQAGRYASSLFTGQQPVAPSPIPSRLTRETPRELTKEEIQGIIQAYAQAAKRVQQAGFDGVEVLAGTGYLISEFLSPLTNKREDEYGGELANRMRFALEVIAAIRQAVGNDYPLIVRIAGNDFMPGGHTNAEARVFAQALEKAGVTAINVTGGWHETMVPQITMNVPPGAFRYLARGVKESVSVPVIASNRITTPELAEDILASGDADLVCIGRPLIADPFFPLKAQQGAQSTANLRKTLPSPALNSPAECGMPEVAPLSDRPFAPHALSSLAETPSSFDPAGQGPIRPCVACNQGCLDRVFQGKPVICLVNPEAGSENDIISLKPQPATPETKRCFLVIGGGVAGLEFARVASLYGHDVEIWEKEPHPGGQLLLAAAPPGRADFLRFRDYLAESCARQGVTLLCNYTATLENILHRVEQGRVTDIVVATGATPLPAPFPVASQADVVQAWDVLAGRAATGQKVVIVGGGAVGVEAALYLAHQGTIGPETLYFLLLNRAENPETLQQLMLQGRKQITLVEMASGVGRDIGSSTRWSMLAELKMRNVKILTETTVQEIRPDGVWVKNAGGEQLIPCDTAVLAIGSASNNGLYAQLQERLPAHVSLHLLGDAVKPAKILDAVHSAHKKALELIGS